MIPKNCIMLAQPIIIRAGAFGATDSPDQKDDVNK